MRSLKVAIAPAWPWQQLHSPQHPRKSSLSSLPLWTAAWISSALAPCQSMGQSSPIWCAPVSLPPECLPGTACGKPRLSPPTKVIHRP